LTKGAAALDGFDTLHSMSDKRHASELELDVARFEADRISETVLR
jgi:hypothetical protein